MSPLLCFNLLAIFAVVNSQKTISFSGRTWTVRPSSGLQGPGPNLWSDNNVFLDSNGFLHLKLTKVNGQFYSSEVYLTEQLGFGRYQWQVEGRIDLLDQNVVLGLFNYPDNGQGPDGTNEIDIEFSRWGIPDSPVGSYTIYPNMTGVVPASSSTVFDVKLVGGDATTHSFTWTPNSIQLSSNNGFQNDDAMLQFYSWSFAPTQRAQIPQRPLPVHMNLWCVAGQAPTDGQEVEMIIKSFTFTPM